MKRNICIALCAVFLAAPVPSRALDWEIKDVTHTITATVGENSFTMDGEEISLPEGTEVYKKDGYVMAPAEPLLKLLDKKLRCAGKAKGPKITYFMGGHSILLFDLEKNTAVLNEKPIELAGGMELRGDQLYVPLRGLKNILSTYGYQTGEGGLTWNEAAQTAVLRVSSAELLVEGAGRETPEAKGAGAAPEYAVPLTKKYSRLENLGEGYFLAESVRYAVSQPGVYGERAEEVYYVLDNTGKELQKQGGGIDVRMEDLGEGLFLVEEYRRNGKARQEQRRVVDRNGKTMFSLPENWEIRQYSPEGLAKAFHLEKNTAAFMDLKGRLVFDGRFRSCGNFSEGLAAVRTDKGWGYIDRSGKEIIAPQFSWAYNFYNGKAFVRIGKETWVIDRTGQKLKKISENGMLEPIYGEPLPDILREEVVVDLEGKKVLNEMDHIHLQTYYDADGEIPREEQAWAVNGAEGLMAFWDKETGKYGYVDENWNWVIAPTFDEAGKFQDGYAVVRRGGIGENEEYGVIKRPQNLSPQ